MRGNIFLNPVEYGTNEFKTDRHYRDRANGFDICLPEKEL
jgi:hypothetical protein